jgi:hypothetical protein
MKLEVPRQILVKSWNIKFNQNPSSGSRVIPCGRTDMTKLIVAFQSFANASRNVHGCNCTFIWTDITETNSPTTSDWVMLVVRYCQYLLSTSSVGFSTFTAQTRITKNSGKIRTKLQALYVSNYVHTPTSSAARQIFTSTKYNSNKVVGKETRDIQSFFFRKSYGFRNNQTWVSLCLQSELKGQKN